MISVTSRIERGPYLMQGTESSVMIRWATDAAVQGQIWYGRTLGRVTVAQLEPTATREHQLLLTDLVPDTKYYYAIGTAAGIQLGGTEDFYFITAPVPGSDERSLRVWVLGDTGRGNELAARVRDGYLKFTGHRHTDLWLMLGDNAYDNGTLEEYQQGIFEMYPELLRCSALFPAFGNHDAGSANSADQSGVYYDLFTLPNSSSGTAAYYSFDYGNIHFICLDSYGSDRAIDGKMLTWLKQDLAQNQQTWTIAYWHHPPYTKGNHDSDEEQELIEMRENALPILEAAGTDLVLAGHSHAYERSYFMTGHYGTSSTFTPKMKLSSGSGREDESGAYEKSGQAGTVYLVAGTSAWTDPVSSHPAMHTSLSIAGSVVLDIQKNRLDVTFVDPYGERVDYFTIHKLL
jgi:acid phosphatase type 7